MGTWVLELAGAVIGIGRFTPSNRLPGGLVEAGWFIAAGHAGKGFGTEAVRVLVDHAFRTIGLPAMWALIHERNEPSLKLAARLGFLDVADFYQPAGPARVHVVLPPHEFVERPQATLRTERLVVRPLRADDRPAVHDIFSDPEVTRYLSPGMSEPDRIDAMVDHRLGYDGPTGMGHWAFVEDDTVVGIGHLRPSWELPGGVAEIGWYLGREYGGRGLATEAGSALLGHGLHDLGLPAVWALVHRGNKPSLRLAERIGFLDVGTGEHYGDPHRVHVALPRRASLH
jgi:RimJ/RimL family protein N-acetyltransferase